MARVEEGQKFEEGETSQGKLFGRQKTGSSRRVICRREVRSDVRYFAEEELVKVVS